MADIFISYDQSAPKATEDLALDLTQAGHSVWFNSRLLPVDPFRNVIRGEIVAAKAVIVIWPACAVDSEWLYAAAKLAQDMKKLICVRTPDVPAYNVPMPFNRFDVPATGERQKIYAALTRLRMRARPSAPLPEAQMEVTGVTSAWGRAKASGDPALVQTFIRRYGGRHPFFADMAETFLAELLAGAGGVVAAKPVGTPPRPAGDVFLRSEPSMHTAAINRIGVNAAGTLMVTGSDDKTARLWALPRPKCGSVKALRPACGSPELLRTFRVPIGESDDGKVYAVALSPDGKWVAAGGFLQAKLEYNSVYVFEAETGRLATRPGKFCDAVNHLAFSPDGSRLAAALGGGEGMRLWETADWGLLAQDEGYGGWPSCDAAFDGANRLYTVALDGQIRRYGADGQLEARAATLASFEPASIAVHPSGGKIAIGFNDTTSVEVYDARTLKQLYAADTRGISGGALTAVAWSANGERLFAGGRTGQTPESIVIWQLEGRGKRIQAPLSQGTILQLLPCAAGIVALAQGAAFGLVAGRGAKRFWQEGVTADMREKKRDAFMLSGDGRRVRFGLGAGGAQPVLFDLAAFLLSDAPGSEAGLAQPMISGLAVNDWEDAAFPDLNGRPIKLNGHERSRALAIAPDAQRFVLGTEYRLCAYRADGEELWQKPGPGIAYGVNIAGDGKLIVAAYGDGTIRWHRLSNGQELLALFVHAKDRRHIAWTPQGYYAASPGAEDLLGWHVNRGYGVAPDFYPAPAFAGTYCRPDIVKAALDV